MHAIAIDDVTKRYGEVTALDGVSLAVEAGTTFGLLGTNGAGKTTLFRLLVGHDHPDDGSVEVAGLSPAGGTAVRRRVGYLPEDAGFPPALTGREVLAFHARMRDVPATERPGRVEGVLSTVGLSAAADRPVGGYSHGMNRRLGLATALVARPDVLLLDEPTAGLDPEGIEAFHGIVERLGADTDVTIVLTSHALAEVERVAGRVAILADGRVRAEGAVDDLRSDASETVTVTARFDSHDGADRAARALRDLPAVASIGRPNDRRLAIACGRADAYGVVSTLHDAADPAGFEVREPGLDAAFHRAVGTPAAEGSP